MIKLHYPFHIICYYVSTSGCLLLASLQHGFDAALLVLGITLLQIIWQFKIKKETKNLFYCMIVLTLVGTIVDSLFSRYGLIKFADNPLAPRYSPYWMMMLWLNLAVFCQATLFSLLKSYTIIALFSLVGFAFAYALGVKIGAALFPHGYVTAVLIGVIWAVLLPCFFYFYQRVLK